MACLLEAKDLTVHLGTDDRRIRVCFSLAGGGRLAIRGPSGAGKTTLLRILARLQPCPGGGVLFNGRSWLEIPARVWRTQVHYVAQSPVLFNGTVWQNLSRPYLLSVHHHQKRSDQARPDSQPLARSAVITWMHNLRLDDAMLDQDARTLSGGEAARVALLRSLFFNPDVLLLDEPTAALDPESSQAVRDAVDQWQQAGESRAVILVTHGMAPWAAVDLEEIHLREDPS